MTSVFSKNIVGNVFSVFKITRGLQVILVPGTDSFRMNLSAGDIQCLFLCLLPPSAQKRMTENEDKT